MKWNNSEMSLTLREDNIVYLRVNEEVKTLTVEAAEECIVKLQEAMEHNGTPKVLLFLVPKIYIPKSVMRCYTDIESIEIATALICESLTAWLMGNIALTIGQRFMALNPETAAPIKAFKKEAVAIKWSLERLKEVS
ncbi:MAG: Unknown protein [uncultured Aureispira sp.]|uniref:Uncharacterized protein n=1 Tax=uncultured Aureispira sp. TaxID=1331704 RepID=A0A6S6UF66_9BACT|nr:MAG: Unknown protein [uncultured Aureispira sp.]